MRRRSGYKRKRTFRRGYDRVGGFYGRARKRRRFPRIEKKFYDAIFADASIAGNWQFPAATRAGPEGATNTLNDIPQGVTESTRIGRKCTITNIYMRLNFEFLQNDIATLGAALTASETIRIVIVWDKQVNGTAAPITQLFDTDTYNSFRNLANNKRFRILYDKTYSWNTGAIGGGDGTNNDSSRMRNSYQVKIAKKCFIPIEFDSTTGAVSEMRSNNLSLWIGSKEGSRMAMTSSTCRLRYIDY